MVTFLAIILTAVIWYFGMKWAEKNDDCEPFLGW